MSRGAWAAVILVAWGVGMAWLVKREVFRPTSARLADAARAIPPGALYYRIDIGGQQIGSSSLTIDTLADSIRLEEVLLLEFPTLGRRNRTSARITAVIGRTLQLRSLAVRYDDDHGPFTARGEVAQDSVLRIRLVSAGDSQWTRASVPRFMTLPALLPLRLAFAGELSSGTKHSVRVFDPVLLSERRVSVTVVRETTLVVADSADFDSTTMAWVPVRFDTVPAFRFDIVEEGGAGGSAWIDAQGRVVRATNPFGLVVERSAFEISHENFRRRATTRALNASRRSEPGDVIATTVLAARLRPARASVAELRIRVPEALRHTSVFASSELRGDTVILRRAADSAIHARYLLSDPPDTASLGASARWLGAEPLIQSENPRIRAQARLLVGRERDPGTAARRILDWVHAGIRKQGSGSVPNALQVFESRQGDCNEHTVLFIALARAAGIPARAVAGVLYHSGRFYYHAWPEVYLNHWTAVDPTLGQFPADAARLPLVTGGLARPVELARLVGKLKLEVL
jgi:transglutaminase-like putative cysteine protease